MASSALGIVNDFIHLTPKYTAIYGGTPKGPQIHDLQWHGGHSLHSLMTR
jgi:hypothetical protein